METLNAECESIESDYDDVLTTDFCDSMLDKQDVELFLQKDNIYDEILETGKPDDTMYDLQMSFDDRNNFLHRSPLGIIKFKGNHDFRPKTMLRPTFHCTFETNLGDDISSRTCDKKADIDFTREFSTLSESEQYHSVTYLELSEYLKSLGNKQFQKKLYREAIISYTKAIEFCPPDSPELAIFYQNRAAAHDGLGDNDECLKDCTEALKVNPMYVKALQRRARKHFMHGETQKAFEDAVTARFFDLNNGKDDNFSIIWEYGQDLADRYLDEDPPEIVLMASHMIRSYLADFGSLDIYCVPFCANSTEDILYSSIVKDLKREMYDTIETRCSEVINMNGNHKFRALLLRGSMRFCKHDIASALHDFDLVITFLDSCNDDGKILMVDALVKRARLKASTGDISGCTEDIDEAKLIDVGNASIYHNLAVMDVDRFCDGFDSVLGGFRKAILLNDSFIAPRLGLGEILFVHAKEKDSLCVMEEGASVFKDAVISFPGNSEVLRKYGQFLLKTGKLEEALVMFESAISVAPGRSQHLVGKAHVFLEKGNLTGALQLCQNALKIDDHCYEVLRLSGMIEFAKGCYEQALPLFEKSIAYSPRLINVLAPTLALLEECKIRKELQKAHSEHIVI